MKFKIIIFNNKYILYKIVVYLKILKTFLVKLLMKMANNNYFLVKKFMILLLIIKTLINNNNKTKIIVQKDSFMKMVNVIVVFILMEHAKVYLL